MSSHDVSLKFRSLSTPFAFYRDASYGPCTYKHTLFSCFRALEQAVKAGLFNLNTFDIKGFEFYEKVQNGDITWMVPNKIIAFSTPNSTRQ